MRKEILQNSIKFNHPLDTIEYISSSFYVTEFAGVITRFICNSVFICSCVLHIYVCIYILQNMSILRERTARFPADRLQSSLPTNARMNEQSKSPYAQLNQIPYARPFLYLLFYINFYVCYLFPRVITAIKNFIFCFIIIYIKGVRKIRR